MGRSALAGADTCVAPVLDVAEVVDDPQFAARRVVGAATHPDAGRAPTAGAAAGGHGPRPDGVVPLPDMTGDTDTEHLLKEAGVDGETVARWVAQGVVA